MRGRCAHLVVVALRGLRQTLGTSARRLGRGLPRREERRVIHAWQTRFFIFFFNYDRSLSATLPGEVQATTRRGHTIEEVRNAESRLSGLFKGPAVLGLDPAVGVAVEVGRLLRERRDDVLLFVVIKTTVIAELLEEFEFRVKLVLRSGHAACGTVGVHAGAKGMGCGELDVG